MISSRAETALLYGQSPSKDTVSGQEGAGGQRQEEERDTEKEAGMMSCVPLSQPLSEVFRKNSFGGVLFVLLPLVLLYSHQPAVVLFIWVVEGDY